MMLGKTFKGLTDAMLEWQTQEFLARETDRDAGTVYVRPDSWSSRLQRHAGQSAYPGGLALRFARVKRIADKRPRKPIRWTRCVASLPHRTSLCAPFAPRRKPAPQRTLRGRTPHPEQVCS